MKEITGKMHRHSKSKLPRKLFVDNKYITLEKEIAKRFNEVFSEIGSFLARQIRTSSKPFESFLKKASTILPEKCLTINELKDVFFSLKMNKSIGADEISFNVIKNCFRELRKILRYVFNLSMQTGIFPDPLKIAKLTPLFKTSDLTEISNYRPISVLLCFSKLLQRIMRNHFYSYLTKKYQIRSSSAFKKVIPQSMALFNWLTKFMNHLRTAITHLGFSLIYARPLTLLTMQYY